MVKDNTPRRYRTAFLLLPKVEIFCIFDVWFLGFIIDPNNDYNQYRFNQYSQIHYVLHIMDHAFVTYRPKMPLPTILDEHQQQSQQYKRKTWINQTFKKDIKLN
ncbi:MAG: hypothetical protein Q8875_02790 [Pigeon pea little leaf phytoplasma]|nr:hypothetical protein [Pigeon pea little leaf phytoplasma]